MINKPCTEKLNEALKNNSIEDILFNLPAIQDFYFLINYMKLKPSKNTTHIHNCRIILIELLKLTHTSQKIAFTLKNLIYIILDITYSTYSFTRFNKETFEITFDKISDEQTQMLEETIELLLKGFKTHKLDAYEERPDILFYLISVTLNKNHLEDATSLYNDNSFELLKQSSTDIDECIRKVSPLLLSVNKEKYNYLANSVYNIPYIKNNIVSTKDENILSNKIHKLFLLEKVKNNIKDF